MNKRLCLLYFKALKLCGVKEKYIKGIRCQIELNLSLDGALF